MNGKWDTTEQRPYSSELIKETQNIISLGFDFMTVNVTFIYQFLPMDSEND